MRPITTLAHNRVHSLPPTQYPKPTRAPQSRFFNNPSSPPDPEGQVCPKYTNHRRVLTRLPRSRSGLGGPPAPLTLQPDHEKRGAAPSIPNLAAVAAAASVVVAGIGC